MCWPIYYFLVWQPPPSPIMINNGFFNCYRRRFLHKYIFSLYLCEWLIFQYSFFRSMKLHNMCKKSGGALTQVFLLLKWILKTRINAFRACEFQLLFPCLFIPVKWTDRFLFEKQGISGILFNPHAVICFQCSLTLCCKHCHPYM